MPADFNMHSTMFDTPEDTAVRYVYDLLRAGERDNVKLTSRQRGMLHRITDYHRGAAKAIPVGHLAELYKTTPREIKSDVRDLRLVFRVPIGSSRQSDGGGYYLITSKDEAIDTARPFIEQGKAEFAIARALLEPHGLAEFEGQQLLRNGAR